MSPATIKRLLKHIVAEFAFIKRIVVTFEDGRVVQGTLYCDITEDKDVLPLFMEHRSPGARATENIDLSGVVSVEVVSFGMAPPTTFRDPSPPWTPRGSP